MRETNEYPRLRFRTLDELEGHLERAGGVNFSFRVIPIAGRPETYRYRGEEQSLTGVNTRRRFDSPRAFACYAFQCDAEGYSHTEHVDFERLD